MSFFDRIEWCFSDYDKPLVNQERFRLIIVRTARGSFSLLNFPNDFYGGLDPEKTEVIDYVARQLIKEKWVPELVLCSSAQRAQETWQLLSTACFKEKAPVVISESLSTLRDHEIVLEVLRRQPNRMKTLLIVGHALPLKQVVLRLTQKRIQIGNVETVLLETTSNSWFDAINRTGTWSLVKRIFPSEEWEEYCESDESDPELFF